MPHDERPTTLQERLRQQAPPGRAERAQATFSRWRGSDTSFGPIGRILLTIGAIILLVAGEPMLRGFIVVSIGFDVPGTGFIVLYVVAAIPAGIYLFGRIWKRTRIA